MRRKRAVNVIIGTSEQHTKCKNQFPGVGLLEMDHEVESNIDVPSQTIDWPLTRNKPVSPPQFIL